VRRRERRVGCEEDVRWELSAKKMRDESGDDGGLKERELGPTCPLYTVSAKKNGSFDCLIICAVSAVPNSWASSDALSSNKATFWSFWMQMAIV